MSKFICKSGFYKNRSMIHVLEGVDTHFYVSRCLFLMHRSADMIHIQVKVHTKGGLCVSLLILIDPSFVLLSTLMSGAKHLQLQLTYSSYSQFIIFNRSLNDFS